MLEIHVARHPTRPPQRSPPTDVGASRQLRTADPDTLHNSPETPRCETGPALSAIPRSSLDTSSVSSQSCAAQHSQLTASAVDGPNGVINAAHRRRPTTA